MQYAGDADDVFAEAPVQSAHPRDDGASLRPSQDLATNHHREMTSLPVESARAQPWQLERGRRSRLTITSAADLDDIDEEAAGTEDTHTHTHTFNGPLSGTTQVSRYEKGKTNLDFTETRDSEWQWHQLSHMQVCTSLQTDNHASTPTTQVFYRPDALPAAQPTASKHCRQPAGIEY